MQHNAARSVVVVNERKKSFVPSLWSSSSSTSAASRSASSPGTAGRWERRTPGAGPTAARTSRANRAGTGRTTARWSGCIW
uniref:Uncharacterized protein n=1 Tax=Mycena chlorophos TaxID=658473 RepID=A0ABQ0M916_MYCCL|nr:predicted protein [Mycena chlorophos]